jgi:HAD superfamily hydrolase (TIGR01509 family)
MSALVFPGDVEAVVFDMDGLLVDSERVYRDSMFEVTRAQGRDIDMAVFLRMVGAPKEQTRRVILEHFGADFEFEPWMAAVTDHAHAAMAADLVLKAGAAELIDDLQSLGLPRAVATSSSHAAVRRQLGPLADRFDVIVAHGDYARGKPDPDPFLTAAARLGVAPAACLALEDSHNGVRAAHAAGMMTVMVPDLMEATADIRALCVGVADTLHDVRDALAGQARARR